MKSSPDRKSPLVSVAALLPLALVGGVLLFCGGFYLREVRHIETSLLAQESVRIDAFARLFQFEIHPVADDLRQLVNGDGLRAYVTNGQSADLDRVIQQATFFSRLNPAFDQIRYLDNRGREVLRIDRNGRIVPPGELQDKSGRSYFQKAFILAAGQVYLSAFDLNVENGRVEQPPKPTLRFAMPVFDDTGRRRGVYAINYLGGGLFSHLQDLRPDVQHRLRVLNAQGYWLKAARPEEEWGFMFPERKAATLARTEPELWARLAGEPKGQTRHAGGIFSWRRIDLRQSVAGSLDSVVAEDAFLVIVSEISDQEFGALLAPLRMVFGVLTVLLLASAIIAGRLFRSRRQTLQALRRSEENLTVTLHSIGDAVLATDAGGRVTRMNLVAEKLTGWTQAEALGRPVAEVFRIINEKTRSPAIVPVDKVLATGEIHGLANHTVLIARDGTERTIADSAAPIRDGDGRILGVVLVFRDVTESRRAQAELDRFFSLSLDFLCIANADGYFKRVSPAVTDILGWSEEEFLARPFLDFIHPEDHAATLREVERQVVLGEKVLHFENRYRRKDGTWRVLAWRSVPQPDGLMYATARDVTESREMEEALRTAKEQLEFRVQERTAELAQTNETLRQSEERQRLIFASVRDYAIIILDPGGRVVSWNSGAQRLKGYTAEEIVGQHFSRFYPEELVRSGHPGKILATAATEGRLEDEGWRVRKDGSRFWASVVITALRNEAGELRGFSKITRDMSERKLAEEKIRALNTDLERRVQERTAELQTTNLELADFKAALDEHAIVAIADPRGKITYANDKFCAISKYSREELLGQDHRIVNSGHHPKAFIRELWETIAGGRVWHGEIKNRAKDGTIYWVNTTIVPLLGAEGKPAQYIAIRADITPRKEAEESLQRANAELGQASQLKDEFLANMSHELRTPLNAILGLSEALLEQVGGALTPRQVKSITTISTSGQHLLALINDILDLSKIEAGKLDLHAEPLNVQEFCESCLVFVRTQAMQKHIGVAFEADGRTAKFAADPKRFKQVLVNLLTNAVKFTPEGGRIGLTVAAPEGEDVMRFTVWDTGVGIAPGDQQKLFRAFTQIDSGLARMQEGTGLGLALVAKLMELHGGGVALESEPGKGSRFTVTLPQIAGLAPEPAPQDQTDRRGYRRALIIEDDPNASEQLERYLTDLTIAAVLHVRGEESVEVALRERPDVILLDILLPKESGWVVLARLKEHPGTRDIPVAVISVVDEPQKSRALGAAAHLTKPVTREQLAGFLQRGVVKVARSVSPFIEQASSSGLLILLAEDNAANRETLGGYLEDKGYRLHYALNGREAVTLARELRPALILMDIQMPVMDGLTAIKKIRVDAALRGIPIVALTALAMPGDRERCLAAGATDYMSKPVSLKALAALVTRLASTTGGGK